MCVSLYKATTRHSYPMVFKRSYFLLLFSVSTTIPVFQESRLTVVSHEAKEEAYSKQCTNRLKTHTHKYFTGTKVQKTENDITKGP